MGIKLIILGAGCSMASGYPLAVDMFQDLEEFGRSLGNKTNTEQLRRAISHTLKWVADLRNDGAKIETLDELARHLHDKHHENIKLLKQAKAIRNRFVMEAKMAIIAYFLHLEEQAVQKGLPGYGRLMDRIFGADSKMGYKQAVQRSSYRVLTFNYDRLFELSFQKRFPDFTGNEALYGNTVLNSGYNLTSDHIEIDPSRFSFLKLHGSVGLWGYPDGTDPDADVRIIHSHSIPDLNRPPTITDDAFFEPEDTTQTNNAGRPKPSLIVFPHEKGHLEKYHSNLLSFKDYIPSIKKAAEGVVSQADRIYIIGYSCPDADADGLRSLLAQAKNCHRYVIENKHPAGVEKRLKKLLPPGTIVESLKCCFGGDDDVPACAILAKKPNHNF